MYCEHCNEENGIGFHLNADGAPMILCPKCRDAHKGTRFTLPKHNLNCASLARGEVYADVNEEGMLFAVVGDTKIRVRGGRVSIEDHSKAGVEIMVDAAFPKHVKVQVK